MSREKTSENLFLLQLQLCFSSCQIIITKQELQHHTPEKIAETLEFHTSILPNSSTNDLRQSTYRSAHLFVFYSFSNVSSPLWLRVFVNWPLFWPDQNPLKFGVHQIIWVFFILGRPDTWFPLTLKFLQQIQSPALLELQHFPENPWPREENLALGNARTGEGSSDTQLGSCAGSDLAREAQPAIPALVVTSRTWFLSRGDGRSTKNLSSLH